ncbi:hypothetical protein [Herbaspirillum sp. NPDC087042]|uniref:hypothetical protein n=1 Tax=Herbaspirillum sp. NPDC087042 TaxID=3364004 RepID=UPI00380E741A
MAAVPVLAGLLLVGGLAVVTTGVTAGVLVGVTLTGLLMLCAGVRTAVAVLTGFVMADVLVTGVEVTAGLWDSGAVTGTGAEFPNRLMSGRMGEKATVKTPSFWMLTKRSSMRLMTGTVAREADLDCAWLEVDMDSISLFKFTDIGDGVREQVIALGACPRGSVTGHYARPACCRFLIPSRFNRTEIFR